MHAAILLAMVAVMSNKSYTVFAFGYRGESVAWSIGEKSYRSIDHLAPKLALATYGGDWFLKLDAGWPLGPTGRNTTNGRELYAHYSSAYIAALEVGAHLPTRTGMLAVGLHLAGVRAGVADRHRGSWLAGGAGADGGLSVHFAMPLVELVRVDPSIAFGASVLSADGARAYSGVWASFELELLVKIAEVASLELTTGLDLRRYGRSSDDVDRPEVFTGRAVRFELGVALHDLFGLGSNQF